MTEAVAGVDLVEWQLRVAAGEALPLSQDALGAPRGHAIEARIYAESPENGFLPAGGRVLHWAPPPGAATFEPGAALRVDSGVQRGDLIGVHYDPMIAKVVARGADRAAALAALGAALGQLQVGGLPTNIDFVQRITQHPEFQAVRWEGTAPLGPPCCSVLRCQLGRRS